MSVILVFDDVGDDRQQLIRRLTQLCGAGTDILAFDGKDALAVGASFERHIASWIAKHCADKDIALIVCDKELGRYDNLKGLSATAVSAVALQEGVPFCQYSRQADLDGREIARFKGLRLWSSEEITLEDLDPESWAPQAATIFSGFEQIKAKYKGLGDKSGPPPFALASILDHPESESRIALYGSGNEGFLKEILTFYDPENPDMDLLRKRMPRILGNWLYLSILRFPGILANQDAAASYLNIDCEAFGREDVQNAFQSARYTGPFCELELGPWWWRAELDILLGEAQSEDGRTFLAKEGIEVDACLDPDSKEQAGYYCMLTRKPVSADNSRGGISWFPSGADLARIQKDKFEQITALVGMY